MRRPVYAHGSRAARNDYRPLHPDHSPPFTEGIMRVTHHRLVFTVLGLTVLTLACKDSKSLFEPTDPQRRGPMRISVSTVGSTIDFDPDGYSVQIDGAPYGILGLNAYVRLDNQTTGVHVVQIDGLASNCSSDGMSQRSVNVEADDGRHWLFIPLASFIIVCVANAEVDFGAIAYVSGNGSAADIYVITSAGKTPLRLTSSPGWDGNPAWSPDGSKIAFASMRDGNSEIYVMNADGSDPVRLTNNAAFEYQPAWSPDGAKVAFARGDGFIYVMNADGTSAMRLTSEGFNDSAPDWSPDGSRIAFSRVSGKPSRIGIWIVNADGSDETQLTSQVEIDADPAWSPDGKSIAFTRGNEEVGELYLVNADGSGLRLLTNVPYASGATWSRDGRHLAFGIDLYYGCFPDNQPCNRTIRIVDANGSLHNLPLPPAEAFYDPAWRR